MPKIWSMFFQVSLNAKKKKIHIFTYMCISVHTHACEAELPASPGAAGCALPPSPRASPRAGRGQGPASADVTQLPGFSKERRTAGWQSLRSHICSFRILRAYSTRRLTPAAPLLLHSPAAQAWQGLGPRGSWEPAPYPLPPPRAAAPTRRRVVGSFIPPSGWERGQAAAAWIPIRQRAGQ